MESLLKNNGWQYIEKLDRYEKQNSNGYIFRVFFNEKIDEWCCRIDDEYNNSCGYFFIPSYDTLFYLFMFYY